MTVYRYEHDGLESLAATIAAACAATTDRSIATYRERVDQLTAPERLEQVLTPENPGIEQGQATMFAVHDCYVTLTVESTDTVRVEAEPTAAR